MGLQGRLLGHLAPQWAAQAPSTRARVGRRTMPAPSSGASWLAAPRPHTTALFGGPAPSSDLNTEDDQPAAPGLPEFRVSPAFAVDCLCQGEVWHSGVGTRGESREGAARRIATLRQQQRSRRGVKLSEKRRERALVQGFGCRSLPARSFSWGRASGVVGGGGGILLRQFRPGWRREAF